MTHYIHSFVLKKNQFYHILIYVIYKCLWLHDFNFFSIKIFLIKFINYF